MGTTPYEGITHAEMEKEIRGAYQLFANAWEYTEDECDGVKYIQGNIGCPYDCSEGDGYALLAAAYMGDKTSFDGLWMRIHDTRRVKQPRYIDGKVLEQDYEYGNNTLNDYRNSVTDGDMDIALALYVAWRQWGDDSGHTAFNGDQISYRKEMIDVISGLAELTTRFEDENPRRCNSGDIGLDGYLKNGNTYVEITDWISNNPLEIDGVKIIPEFQGPTTGHTDYLAPAYTYEFYKLLGEIEAETGNDWLRSQFLRATASSDWILGSWLEQDEKYLPYSETYDIDKDNKVTLNAGNEGSRFRSVWRTSLNYVWNGNPDYSWNPETHQAESKGNTYEQTVCERTAAFCSAPQKWTGSDCIKMRWASTFHDGPGTLTWDVNPTGEAAESSISFILNWIPGVSAASAVGSENLDLTAKLYRQCQIEWDFNTDSVPTYFDGWFRLLGMLTATGNLQAPSAMNKSANVRLYKSLKDGKTTCYPGENVTYILSYRNYGSDDANSVVISEQIPDGFDFVSAENGGSYDAATNTITFKIAKIAARKGDVIGESAGSVSYTIKAKTDAEGVFCSTSTLKYGDVTTTADIYPNNITATFETNKLTILPEANTLVITKVANKDKVNAGDTFEYTVAFSNESNKTNYLVGGRKDVNISFATNNKVNDGIIWMFMRLYHDAAEPLINYGNYRVSYFMSNYNGRGVNWHTSIYEGQTSLHGNVDFTIDTISSGNGETGQLHKLSVKFEDALATTTLHLSNYFGSNRIHEGVESPLRVQGYIYDIPWEILDMSDDYSFDKDLNDVDDGLYYPVSPRYTEIGNLKASDLEEYIPNICQKPTKVATNIAVEEWDGNSWRLIQGSYPNIGKDVTEVVISDTLPWGIKFVEFRSECPYPLLAKLKSETLSDGRDVITWKSSSLMADKIDTIKYVVKVSDDAKYGNMSSNVEITSKETKAASAKAPVSYSDPTNVNEYVSNANSNIAAPNPTSDSWTILRDCKYEMYCISGIKVEQGNAVAGSKIGSNLPAGIYLIKTTTEDSQMLIKK